MKVVLLKDVVKLGKRYDVKTVSDGHALNFLIPQKLALAATPDVLKRFETEKAKSEGEKKVHMELLHENMKKLDGTTLTITGKANEKGHLFAGLQKDAIISELLKQSQIQIDPNAVELANPIKEIGEYKIHVKSEGNSATFKLVVKAA